MCWFIMESKGDVDSSIHSSAALPTCHVVQKCVNYFISSKVNQPWRICNQKLECEQVSTVLDLELL